MSEKRNTFMISLFECHYVTERHFSMSNLMVEIILSNKKLKKETSQRSVSIILEYLYCLGTL